MALRPSRACGFPRSPLRRVSTLTHLETQAAPEPLGIADAAPRLSWAMASDERGVRQRAFRVLVASKPELVREGRADVWDSGEVASPDPWVVYAGRALASRTRYYWSVRVWAGGLASDVGGADVVRDGVPGGRRVERPVDRRPREAAGADRRPKARPTTRRSAPPASSVARCRWLTRGFAAARIKNDQGECREIRPAPMLRKSFTIAKPVHAGPRLLVRPGLQRPASQRHAPSPTSVLDPGFTDYSQTVLYTTHDVTGLLHPGENVIASELGSGHYDDATRTWDWGWEKAEWRATPRLRLDLYVTYADGSEQVVASDGTWKVSVAGPTRYDSYYLGETYDARREIAGLGRPRLRRLGAGPRPRVVERARGCRARADPRAHPRRGHAAARARGRSPSPGVVVYDVGQNLTGWAEIRVERARGHRRSRSSTRRSSATTARPARSATTSSSASCRPTTTSRAARATSAGPRASATRASSTCSSARPTGQPLAAGVAVSRRAHPAGADGARRDLDLRVEQRDAEPHPPEHHVGDPEQPARASSPTRRSTRRTRGPATRSSPREPRRSCSTPSGCTGRCSRTCSTRRPSRAR